MQITTIGLDLAKNVFQVHGVDAEGKVAVRRKLRRAQRCVSSSQVLRHASSEWKLAARRIFGLEN
jgi:transposase